MGDTDYEALAQKKEDETLTRYCTKSEKTIAGGMWRAMGWTHDTRKKRYSFLHGARHGGKIPFSTNTTKVDFQQPHEMEAQSRLYIRRILRLEHQKKRCQTAEDKRDFVTS